MGGREVSGGGVVDDPWRGWDGRWLEEKCQRTPDATVLKVYTNGDQRWHGRR
jgi:hypothetical protein